MHAPLGLLFRGQSPSVSFGDGCRQTVETGQPGDLFDQVYLALDVGPEARNADLEQIAGRLDIESDRTEQRHLLILGNLVAEKVVGSRRAEGHRARLGRRGILVDHIGRNPATGQLGEQHAGARSGEGRTLGIDPALEARGGLRPQLVASAGVRDRRAVEACHLENHRRRVPCNLGVLATHDSGDPEGTLRVGDQ